MESATWVDCSGLPSKGLPYPEGATIRYRVMTFGEIRTFSQSKLKDKSKIEFVFKGLDLSFDPWELTVPDYTYLTIARKLSTIGNDTYRVPAMCYHCEEQFDFVFDLKDLKFQSIDAPSLPIVANINGKELHFKPLTIKAWLDLKMKDTLDDMSILAKQVVNMPFKEAYDVIYKADGREAIEDITAVEEKLKHHLEVVEKPCKHCQSVNYIDVRDEELIIYPFRESDQPAGDRLRFGV